MEQSGEDNYPQKSRINNIHITMDQLSNISKIIRKRQQSLKHPVLIAIDGRSGVGKSTIADQLAAELNGVVIKGDDFFSGGTNDDWRNRTTQEKVDLVIDWRKLRREAIEPLLAGKAASWHSFDWVTWQGLAADEISMGPTSYILIDGIYSNRSEFDDLVDFSILVVAPEDQRLLRLINRETAEYMEDWHQIWDEAEDYYFSKIRPRESFDFILMN